MQAFLVANPEGGSGESTLATNLADHFTSRDESDFTQWQPIIERIEG